MKYGLSHDPRNQYRVTHSGRRCGGRVIRLCRAVFRVGLCEVVQLMLTFIFIICLIAAALLTRVNPALCIPPLVAAYLIARFIDFQKVSDRSFFGILAGVLISLSFFFVIKSWL